tara:strand:+ start:333 stop:935 length:603 start_codon:yes stop_codon:yes gene_type:complete
MLKLISDLDKATLLWIHQYVTNPIFDLSMPFITNEENWIFPILFLFLFLGFKSGKRGRITLVLLIIALSITDSVCAQILKPLFERVRPSHLNMEGLNLLVPRGGKWSMPSNHAANMFTLAVVLSYFYRKTSLTIYSLALVVSFSRVYVGVHFPGDIIIGALLGYTTSWVVLTFWVILKMRELKKGKTWVWYEDQPPIFKY